MTTHTLRVDVPYQGKGFAVSPFSVELRGNYTEAQADRLLANPTVSGRVLTLLTEGMAGQPDLTRAKWNKVALTEPDHVTVIRARET